MKKFLFCAAICCAGIFFTTESHAAVDVSKLPAPATHKVDFTKDVQPIFADRCYQCHGPKKQEASFRLDQKSGALHGSENGAVILPGKSAESVLIHAVSWVRSDLKMPKKGERLTAEQIGLLRAWIDQGAEWPETTADAKDPKEHWAFKAPVRPKIPETKNSRWVRSPVDNFILARLEKEKLKPASEADKTTLLRRLSLDLIGLPPTVAEVDAFFADKSPDAYAQQVDRLLASPHYGERWARHWLDAARYADSDGFEKDKTRVMWFYRDWVVNALNQDVPYDQFVIKQLAGDLLPNATQDDVVATGFLRNSMINEEGGIDPEQFRMEAMFDRMDCIGKSVLGLTIQCAQCHNHKFDPLKQEEYYQLMSFLNNDHEAKRVVHTPQEQMLVANLSRQMRDIEEGLRHTTPDWEARMAKWEDEMKSNQPEWIVVRPTVEEITTGGQKYLPQPDGSFLAQGYAVGKSGVHLWLTNDLQNVTAFRIELLTDADLPANGPGRSLKGMCAFTDFTVDVSPKDFTRTNRLKFDKVTADFEQPETPLGAEHYDKSDRKRVVGPASFANDENDDTAWGIDAGPGRRNQDRKIVFQCATNAGLPDATVWDIRIVQRHGGWNNDDNMNNNIGRFRISVTTNSVACAVPSAPSAGTADATAGRITADPLPKRVRDIFAVPREKRSPQQIAAVFSHWRTTVADFKETSDKIEKLWAQWPEGTTQLTLMARDEPRETHQLKRGDFLKPGKTVSFGVPEILHPLPSDADGSRLTLAKWLVDKKSPTAARSFVNRIWQNYFGIGLVNTPEDFGTRCEEPSHPELLDWLACEFMDPSVAQASRLRVPAASGRQFATAGGTPAEPAGETPALQPWSIKHIHRLIVTSATYRESSRITPELYSRDAYNRLLARGPRFRVEGEIVRDIALSASGLLNPELGGRSIFAPAPQFLFERPASYGPKNWPVETDAQRYRRSLYIFKFRSVPFPLLQTFDAPNGDFSCVRRMRSNTPLQALVSLNETEFVECAQALALRVLSEGGKTDSEKISYAFRRALSRPPTDAEKKELLNLLYHQQQRIADGWVNANELATGKIESPKKLPEGTTPTQLAAYTVVSRVLLNLDETITKE